MVANFMMTLSLIFNQYGSTYLSIQRPTHIRRYVNPIALEAYVSNMNLFPASADIEFDA